MTTNIKPEYRQHPGNAACPKVILCSGYCVERRRRHDPQPVPQPKNPKQPGTGAKAGVELNTEDLIGCENA